MNCVIYAVIIILYAVFYPFVAAAQIVAVVR